MRSCLMMKKAEVSESTKEARKEIPNLKLYGEIKFLEGLLAQARTKREQDGIRTLIEQLKLGRVRLIIENGQLKDLKRVYKARKVIEEKEKE